MKLRSRLPAVEPGACRAGGIENGDVLGPLTSLGMPAS